MDNFSTLFEKVNEQESPEDILLQGIAEEIAGMVSALEGDYWFDKDISYSDSDVLAWLKIHRRDFYIEALERPEIIEGNDAIAEALEALGMMKDWHDVEEEELETPEDAERWRSARGYYDEE